jgi:hypothetical protein
MTKKILSSNYFIFFAVSLLTATAYLLTVSTRLTWANFGNDGGDFLAAILTGGIPHPTGYPTYTLLGIMFQQLPMGDAYFRAAMLSWLPAALSAGLLALWVRKFLNDQPQQIAIITALFAGMVWGMMPFLWSQAVIIEVHGLQSLFFVLAIWWIWLLQRFDLQKQNYVILFLLSFSFGLALGNHITIVLFFPVIIFSLIIAHKRGLSTKLILVLSFSVLIGTLVYLYLPLRAAHFPPINWGNPQSWQGFLWVISGDPYHNLLLGISFSQILTRIAALANILLQQFGVIGVILAVIGAIQYKYIQKALPITFIYLFFAFSFFAILYATDDSITYLLAAFLVFTLWIAFAISIILPVMWKRFPLGYALIAVYLIVFLFTIPKTIQDINPRLQTEPADYAEYLLTYLPENAILLTSSDPDSFPLWYYHFGLGWREDLRIIVLPLTQFRWYQETLTHTYPDINFPPLIPQITNSSQSWGENTSDLNPDHPICKSIVQRSQGNSIIVECSTGQNFNFVISD